MKPVVTVPKITLCFLLFFFINSIELVKAQADAIPECLTITDTSSIFEGSILMFIPTDKDNRLVQIDASNTAQELANGYYLSKTFYNLIDESLVIWIDALNNREEDFSTDPNTLELWNLNPIERIASAELPHYYRILQRLNDGQLIAYNWEDRIFVKLTVDKDGLSEPEMIIALADLPDTRGAPVQVMDTAEISFSHDLHYVAHKVSGLQLAIYDLWETKEVWRSSPVPQGVLPISHPTWNSTSDRLVAALFVEDEMQLFLIDPVSKMHVQLTHFSPDPNYGKPGMIPPGSHLSGITWSPDDRYITFVQSQAGGLHLLDTETMTIRNTCSLLSPLFWLPQNDRLLVRSYSTNQIPANVLDVTNYQAYGVFPEELELSTAIGWSPQTIGD